MTTNTAPKARPVRPTTETSRPLGDDALACRSCGVAVEHPDLSHMENVMVWPQMTHSAASRGAPASYTEVHVTRCEECSSRLTRARALVEALNLGSFPGPGEVMADRIDASLASLELLNIRGDKTASLTRNIPDLAKLIEALAPLGGLASWNFNLQEHRVAADTAAPTRWAHVDADLIQSAWRAYGALMKYRIEVPIACPPPEGDGIARGCLMCGRASLRMKPSDAVKAWGDLHLVQPGTLGGATTPDLLAGYICPDCRPAVADEGAPGLPALDRALCAHLGFELTYGGRFTRALGRAWAATPATEPNVKPWGHIDTEALTRLLNAAQYVRRLPRKSA